MNESKDRNSLPPARPQSRVKPLLLNGAVFVLGYALICAAFGLVAPFPEVLPISEKWAHFSQHKDEYDAIFVGSSRVFRQIDPVEFDGKVAAGGHPLHSFNFGQDAMWPPESLYMLRKILDLPLPKLRWVFIEHMDLRTEFKMMQFNGRSAQLAYWHDNRQTLLSFRDVLESSKSTGEKVNAVLKHSQLWLTRAVHIGAGAEMLKAPLWPPQQRPPNLNWQPHRGYAPLAAKELSPADRLKFLKRVQQPPPNGWDHPTRPLLLHELEEIVSLVRKAGAEPIFFSSPTIYKGENFTTAPDGVPLFVFDRPEEYPDLMVPQNFVNFGHLNPKGSELYSGYFAAKFLQHLASRPSASTAH